MKGICCNCGKLRVLNHRLICGNCVKLKLYKKHHFHPDLKGSVKCSICNYSFPNNKSICVDICCGCCPEKYDRYCKKELMLGRKGISLKISAKTKQVDIMEIREFKEAKENMFL